MSAARAYDPSTGSFIQRDPISYVAGPHLYQYVGADPVNFLDPFGLDSTPDGKTPPTPGPPSSGGGHGVHGSDETYTWKRYGVHGSDEVYDILQGDPEKARKQSEEWASDGDFAGWDIDPDRNRRDREYFSDPRNAPFQRGEGDPWGGYDCDPETEAKIRYALKMRLLARQAQADINHVIVGEMFGAGLGGVLDDAGKAAARAALGSADDAAKAGVGAVGRGGSRAPDFVTTPAGQSFRVPHGASGPHPVASGRGFQYTGGSGGNGLDSKVSNVRFMDPTPKYPKGYVNYTNSTGQSVNPATGQTVSRGDPAWHIPMK